MVSALADSQLESIDIADPTSDEDFADMVDQTLKLLSEKSV
jgi:hypothetical protein